MAHLANAVDVPIGELVVSARNGDRDAFDVLYARTHRMVRAVVYERIRNSADTEDVTQDVFVKAYAKLDELEEPAAFVGWLRTIALRFAINFAVRQGAQRFGITMADFGGAVGKTPTPIEEVIAVETAQRVRLHLLDLRPLDRESIELFYMQDLSLIEMSDVTGAPVGTIKRRLHVARRRFGEDFDPTRN